MAVIIEVQRQRPLEEGEYYAILRDVQEVQGKWGPVLKFWFDITEPGYETTVSGLCSKVATPRSKLFRWLVALGADLSQTETFDVTTLKGAPAIVVVATVTTPTGEEYVNVIDVKSARTRRITHVNPETTSVSGASVHAGSHTDTRVAQNPAQYYPQQQQQQQHSQPVPDVPKQNFQTKKNPFIEEINDLNEIEF